VIYRRGRYFWLKFKWQGRIVRKSTRAEDLRTAERVERIIRQKFALSYARQLKFKGDPTAVSALLADFMQLRSVGRKNPSKAFPSKLRRDRDDEFLRAIGIATGREKKPG
jgi:hypothetical protein